VRESDDMEGDGDWWRGLRPRYKFMPAEALAEAAGLHCIQERSGP